MDRQDIDALLIGALYGELTPADEARLAAHLESHPADRGALDDLKSARAAVRESRIFDLQLDPPQSVSALLLQEAHRRAPKRVVADDGERKESWFYRFTRAFMAHPAMAAAAMLVLVVGVAGTLYMKKGDAQFAEQHASAPAAQDEAPARNEAVAFAPGEPSGAGVAEGTADTGAAAAGSAAVAAAPQDPSAADNSVAADKYAVQLAEETTRRGRYDGADRAKQEQAKEKRQVAAAEAQKKTSSMIVTTPQPEPKELDAPRAKAAKKGAVATADFDDAENAPFAEAPAASGPVVGGAGGAASGRARDGASSGAAAPSTDTATVQRAPAQAAPPPAAPSPPPPAVATAPSGSSSRAPTNAKPSAPAKSAPAKPTTVAKDTKEAEKADKPADAKLEAAPASPPATNSALMAWAKGEHSVTVSLANKGDCVAAAKRAVQVQNRAPDYYAQYMATDRALKKCQVYIAQERDAEMERANKSRAQKRATSTTESK